MIVVALGLLVVAGGGFLARLVRGPSLADRVVALDGLLTIVITAMAAWSAHTGRSTYLMVGVVVGLVGFVATATFARAIEDEPR